MTTTFEASAHWGTQKGCHSEAHTLLWIEPFVANKYYNWAIL